MLDIAADAEEVGVVARQPEDVVIRPLVDRDQVVPVGDPPGEPREGEPARSGDAPSVPVTIA
jgi:hypothetical protein